VQPNLKTSAAAALAPTMIAAVQPNVGTSAAPTLAPTMTAAVQLNAGTSATFLPLLQRNPLNQLLGSDVSGAQRQATTLFSLVFGAILIFPIRLAL
jgi:hypothetical protein